jgi:hypothetical protein
MGHHGGEKTCVLFISPLEFIVNPFIYMYVVEGYTEDDSSRNPSLKAIIEP